MSRHQTRLLHRRLLFVASSSQHHHEWILRTKHVQFLTGTGWYCTMMFYTIQRIKRGLKSWQGVQLSLAHITKNKKYKEETNTNRRQCPCLIRVQNPWGQSKKRRVMYRQILLLRFSVVWTTLSTLTLSCVLVGRVPKKEATKLLAITFSKS